MTSTSVLIPFGGDCPHRKAALDWLLPRFPSDWEVVVGYHDGLWCKAAAVADALGRSHGDLLVIHDADVWCDETVAAVEQCETWAMPHFAVHRLAESSTAAVLDGAEPTTTLACAEKPYKGTQGGGIVVVRRDIYESVPLDPRFQHWGQEDESWGLALQCLAGEGLRLGGALLHMWHPEPERHTRRIGNQTGKLLARRYWNARRDPDAMRQLIEEVSSCEPQSI